MKSIAPVNLLKSISSQVTRTISSENSKKLQSSFPKEPIDNKLVGKKKKR
jgi:hypothetical protein